MTWNTLWPQDRKPTPGDIAEFVDNPLWKALCSWLESGYRTVPRIEYSRCGMAPGWNVKIQKGRPRTVYLVPGGRLVHLPCVHRPAGSHGGRGAASPLLSSGAAAVPHGHPAQRQPLADDTGNR